MPLAVSAALLAASVAGQTPAPPLPEFRADVRVIRLDVSVVDKSGRPVSGLTPEQFTVFEDGQPMEITYFEAVDAQGGMSTSADSSVSLTPPPPRRILLLVDAGRMDIGDLMRARKNTAAYLRAATGPGDWVRLVNLSNGRVWDGYIPEDRERLEAAALGLTGPRSFWAGLAAADDDPQGGGGAFDRGGFDLGSGGFDRPIQERTEVEGSAGAASEAYTSGQFLSIFAQGTGLLGMLEAVLVQLEAVEGRKALVLISPGFPALMGLEQQLRKVATLAREASTAVYYLDSVGLEAPIIMPGRHLPSLFAAAWQRSGGSQDLAEATGGFTYRFSNSILPGLERVGAEMRTYYVVGYTPTRPEDGRFRSVKVKVAQRGASARTKKGYLAGAPPRH
jgi:VWFA-related protein